MIKFSDIERRQHLADKGWEFNEKHFICPRDNERVDYYTLKSPRMKQCCSIFSKDTDIIEREAEAVALEYWHKHQDRITKSILKQLTDLSYIREEDLDPNIDFINDELY